MENLELEKYERKLLPLVAENPLLHDDDDEFVDKVRKIIGKGNLGTILSETSKVEILQAFADDYFYRTEHPNVHLAEYIAGNVHTPDKILDKLAREGSWVGLEVAGNVSTSTVTLLWICKYSGYEDMENRAESQLNKRNVILEDQGDVEEF
jgi:hypothetical protein